MRDAQGEEGSRALQRDSGLHLSLWARVRDSGDARARAHREVTENVTS